ncbi:MAG TPA: glycine--tRNA ligase subunit beta [Bryobacteraceae bacterium]|nr:glycine--tRNA ligase subunit beta [Bryobacteraceae bacterium]
MNLLLEIGTEEIPHWMIPSAVEQLRRMDLFGATPQVDATPRRLVVRATGLPDRQADFEDMVLGPAPRPGFSIGDVMDKATEGFIRKQKGPDDEVFIQRTEKGDRWAVRKKHVGRSTIDVLAETLPYSIQALRWPKTMYWTDKNGTFFIRPIRWIVALLDDQVIPFDIAGVKSGSATRGHRRLGSDSIPMTFDSYESELRKNFVILSSDERREKIEREAQALGAKLDVELIETLTFITEYPTAIKGDFDPAYLELPAEVLTTVMRHHQKYFSVESEPGKLAPHFVAVMNTSGDPEGLVKRGNERVLKARFNDARFFWITDLDRALVERVKDLDRVTFHAKLGSYFFKTERMKALVEDLGGNANAQSAAYLSKADLTTEMVKEFTDLQGIVGGLYARAQGEPEPVWRAIYEHYKPLSMEDSIPATREGQMIALADKLDTLQQCFRVGLVPTGSKDPFALRRAAQGVVKILVEAKLDYELSDLAEGELREFLLDRIKYYFREIRGFKYDEVNAVLASGCGTLADVEARLTALAAVRPTENFEPLAASFKRIQNILKQANFGGSDGSPDPSLLEAGPEADLHKEFERVRVATKDAGYQTALEDIASLRPKVDTFFDKVLVNAKDEKVRANRLTLLNNLLTEFSTIADFSEIVTSTQTAHDAENAVRSGEQKS